MSVSVLSQEGYEGIGHKMLDFARKEGKEKGLKYEELFKKGRLSKKQKRKKKKVKTLQLKEKKEINLRKTENYKLFILKIRHFTF